MMLPFCREENSGKFSITTPEGDIVSGVCAPKCETCTTASDKCDSCTEA
jgi:hypothetical protein